MSKFHQYTAIIEKEENFYVALCPELDIASQGKTVEEARTQAYNRIKNIMLLNMIYRTDIGERWTVESDKLQTWGYL